MSVHVQVRVGAERYALPVQHVLEVADLGEVVAVPGAARHVVGMRNLRGRILPVVDLAALMGAAAGRGERLVVTESADRLAGLVVDEVAVADLPEAPQRPDAEVLAQAVLADGDLIGVLDVDQLFDQLQRGAA